ncbi:SHOCT domain-containing protein [Runella sp.]|uniref:SHOCT domain-containing protein n=1 Tax=Runella sp. TaxID=1960881 RepID=UPI003D0DAA54
MLLSVFVAVLLVYYLNFKRPDDRISRREYEAAVRDLKKQHELVLTKDELKIASKDGQHVALFESERQELLKKAQSALQITRQVWIDELNRLHDAGQISDEEFDREVNKWLDEADNHKNKFITNEQ